MIAFAQTAGTPAVHQARRDELFLEFLPAVETHAKIQFRHLPANDRDEAIAEAIAAAFLNVHKSTAAGTADRLTPSSVANFAVKHVRSCRHVGGGQEGSKDAISRRAQRRNGFRVLGLSWDSRHGYDCVRDGAAPVWEDRLAGQVRPTPAEQAAFRIDFSSFLRQQSDRTRKVLGLLAAGNRLVDVADQLGATPAAICQRRKKAEREWRAMQDEPVNTEQPS